LYHERFPFTLSSFFTGSLELINQDREFVSRAALAAGFTAAGIISPFEPDTLSRKNSLSPLSVSGNCAEDAASLLVCALPYGNIDNAVPPHETCLGVIAPFARFNYYRESVNRMKSLPRLMRSRYGGEKKHYRIFCNSSVLPEKEAAIACGLGALGRNGLVINSVSGSLFVIAAMTLPVVIETGPPITDGRTFPFCASCGDPPPCVAACPTGAARGDGTINVERCIQWYASGHGTAIPAPVLAAWGNRLYGCVSCQEACIHNKRPIRGIQTFHGALPPFVDVRSLLKLSDTEIKTLFKGTAMGLSWLGPQAIRRNALAVLGQ
jgi:epoxyqueuosine reductase